MMKRTVFLVLSLCVLLGALAFPVMAVEAPVQSIEYLEDGSYIVTTIEKEAAHGARMNTVVGSATKNFYSSDHVLQWKMTVTGEFLCDGTTVSCTYASGVTTVIKTDTWSVTNEWSTAGNSTAYYYVTFARKAWGIVVDSSTYSVSVTCDANGNFS